MKNKRKLIVPICFLIFATILSGCEYEKEVVEKDTTTDTIKENEVGIPSLSQTLSVKDEDFSLLVDYDLGNYNLNKWHVTDNKNIGMTVKAQNLPEGYEVSLDHVHADITIKSTETQVNGITQDTMDDTYHGTSQDGFYIDNNNEYYNIFNIEGYTEHFYQLWGYYYGTSSDYLCLTEGELLKAGVYAEKLTVVYDVAIKKPGADKKYVKSVISEILIPVSTDIKTKTVKI